MIERRYIRHPSHLPIRYESRGGGQQHHDRLRNVGEGGLCFASSDALDPETPVRVLIPLLGQVFEVDATVAWCQPESSRYLIGVRFASPQDRFCTRMVEQLCYIEDYRLQTERREGRKLSGEQAAVEWIERFSGQFPALD
jgi:hypothetical protein